VANGRLRRYKGTLYGQIALWAVVAIYAALVRLYMQDRTLIVARIAVALLLVGVAYAVDLLSRPPVQTQAPAQTKPTMYTSVSTPTVISSPSSPLPPSPPLVTQPSAEKPPEPTAAATKAPGDLKLISADIQKIQKGVQELCGDVGDMVGAIADETGRLLIMIGETASRLRADTESLRSALQETARIVANTPSLGALYEVHPAPPVDPKLANEAGPYLQALLGSDAYTQHLLELASTPAIVDVVERHLRSLLQQSSDLYRLSTAMGRTNSERMTDWRKTNGEAQDSLHAIAPLLRRLRRLPELENTLESAENFFSGLTAREMVFIGNFLQQKRAALTTDKQVATEMQRIRAGLASQWLTPVVRLYQLLCEALPVEDPVLHAQTRSVADAHGAADAGSPIDAVQDAATALGFLYKHHELYVADPYQIQADLSPGRRQYTLAQWIDGETVDDRRPIVLGQDSLGRVITPRFEAGNKALCATEIIMILKEDH
jgi:hypothetical protein